jgi:hypothetical protein
MGLFRDQFAEREAPALHKPNTPGGLIYERRKYLARYLLDRSVRDRFLLQG